MKGTKKKSKVVIIVVELICLIALVFGAIKVVGIVKEKHDQEEAARAAAQEAVRQAEEEKQKQAEELNKWNLLLVNPWKAMPDDFTVKTTEVENGYEVDERIADAMKEMLADCREAGYSPQIISSCSSLLVDISGR